MALEGIEVECFFPSLVHDVEVELEAIGDFIRAERFAASTWRKPGNSLADVKADFENFIRTTDLMKSYRMVKSLDLKIPKVSSKYVFFWLGSAFLYFVFKMLIDPRLPIPFALRAKKYPRSVRFGVCHACLPFGWAPFVIPVSVLHGCWNAQL